MTRKLISTLLLATAALPAHTAPHRYDHVVIVVEENRTAGQVVGDMTNAPYITSLANNGVTMGAMFAIEHPSQPNYLQLFSGSNQGVLDDNLPANYSTTPTATYPFTSRNLGAEIIAAGFSFAGFSEGLESATTYATDWADYDPHSATHPGVAYRRKHNPWANWVAKVTPIPANHLASSVNRAFTQFPADFSTLPTVSIVVPDQNHDMHDGSRKQGDDWLLANLDAYAQWARTHNSLLIVTWDEDDYAATNQIPTVLYGAGLRNGTIARGTWTLHNLLRTLEDMYGSTTHAGSAAQLKPIIGPFADDPIVLVKTFRQGLNGYASAKDTMLSADATTTDYSIVHDLNADKDLNSTTAGDQAGQVLVRFDSLFGSGATQIPATAIIHSAKLILYTPTNGATDDFDSNDTFRIHRMIADWTDTATWSSMTAGVATDDVEAASASSFSLVPDVDGGPQIFDVSADLELFRTGTANRGWVVRASSSGTGDGWTLKSSESTTSSGALRPTLEVVWSLPSGFATWAIAENIPAVNSTALSDSDGDGVANVFEYAFNMDPLALDAAPVSLAGDAGMPSVASVSLPGGRALEITFLRRKTGNAGLTYTAQFSGDLANWSGGTVVQTSAVDAEWERITVRDDAATTSTQRFARVQVVLAP